MQRYFAKSLKNDIFMLDTYDYRHMMLVMRMEDGEQIEVVYDNKLYLAQVTCNRPLMTVYKKEQLADLQNNIPPITLIVPILKEHKMDFIFQKGTELGVNKIVVVEMERCVVKLKDESPEKKLIRWTKICKEASEQSKRSSIPKIEIYKNFSDVDNLNGLLITCSTSEKVENIKNVLKKNKNKKITFIIGPEGGLSPKEEKDLDNMKFIKTSLGNNIMRVETVPLYLLSVINYEYME